MFARIIIKSYIFIATKIEIMYLLELKKERWNTPN